MSPSRVKRESKYLWGQWPGMTDAEPVTAPRVVRGAGGAGTRRSRSTPCRRRSIASARGPDRRLSADDIEALATAALFVGQAGHPGGRQGARLQGHEGEGNTAPRGLPRRGYRPLERLRGQGRDRVRVARRAEQPDRRDGDTYAHGYLALARAKPRPAWGTSSTALALQNGPSRSAMRAATRPHRLRPEQPRGDEDRLRASDRGLRPDGGSLDRRREWRALAVRERGHDLPYYRGVPGPHRLPAGERGIQATERYCHRRSLVGLSRHLPIHVPRWPRSAAPGTAPSRTSSGPPLSSARSTRPHCRPTGSTRSGDPTSPGRPRGRRAALREAHTRGRAPHRLALVRLAQGKVKAADEAINAALAEANPDRWARARLFPAQAEIALAAAASPSANRTRPCAPGSWPRTRATGSPDGRRQLVAAARARATSPAARAISTWAGKGALAPIDPGSPRRPRHRSPSSRP